MTGDPLFVLIYYYGDPKITIMVMTSEHHNSMLKQPWFLQIPKYFKKAPITMNVETWDKRRYVSLFTYMKAPITMKICRNKSKRIFFDFHVENNLDFEAASMVVSVRF